MSVEEEKEGASKGNKPTSREQKKKAPKAKSKRCNSQQKKKSNHEFKEIQKEKGKRAARRQNKNPRRFPKHWTVTELKRHPNRKMLVKGKLRVASLQLAYVTPEVEDSPFLKSCPEDVNLLDIVIEGKLNRNRALDGSVVFVEVMDILKSEQCIENKDESVESSMKSVEEIDLNVVADDQVQQQLWDPIISIPNHTNLLQHSSQNKGFEKSVQYSGRVIFIVDEIESERKIVGRLEYNVKPSGANNCEIESSLYSMRVVPLDKRLPFFIPARSEIVEMLTNTSSTKADPKGENRKAKISKQRRAFRPPKLNDADVRQLNEILACMVVEHTIVVGFFRQNSWQPDHPLPPLRKMKLYDCEVDDIMKTMSDLALNPGLKSSSMNDTHSIISRETHILLAEFGIECSNFSKSIQQEVNLSLGNSKDVLNKGWAPSKEDLLHRRDFRNHRIFTIDPTSARDLDDALHIKYLGNNQVEIG